MNLQESIKKILREIIIESKGWGNSNRKLERTFKFKDFNQSIDFVNKVAKIAEIQNHHPDIEINYDKVKISITDHEKGGVSEKCHELVNSIDDMGNEELTEYARTLKNARRHGTKLRFPKSAIKTNPQRFRKYTRDSIQETDPKVGTGKKPEGSGRRLYTDENPSDTVSVKFRTKEDIIDTLNKESFKSKSHKRQSQIINLIHQRVRAAYENAKDPETKKRLKRGLDYITNEKEKSKEKTVKLQKQEQTESVELTERCWKGYTQKGMKTMFGKRYPNCVKKTK